MLSASEWAAQQWAEVELGDQRLTRRAVLMGTKMAAHPEASLPEQMGAPADLKGAYRLLNHAGVTLEDLTAPHRAATLAAAHHAPPGQVVLFPEDTTELDYTHHAHKRGLGPVGKGQHQQGLLLHTTLAVLPETRTVLGVAAVQVVTREPEEGPSHRTRRTPEGRLWEVSARLVGSPPPSPRPDASVAGASEPEVLWVHVADRGSDIFEYMATCRSLHKHFLVRASRNRRCIPLGEAAGEDGEDGEDGDGEELSEYLLDYARRLPVPTDPACAYTLDLPARPASGPTLARQHSARQAQPARAARTAHLLLQWAPIEIPVPRNAAAALRAYPPVHAWIVRAWEPNPPPGVEALEWILITSVPMRTVADARRTLEWYTCRWLDEDFHQCLKTGCQIEQRQLDDGADITRLLGFAVPISARLLQLRQAVRQAPQVLATEVVEPLMVQVLGRRQRTNWQHMTAEQFWQGVSRLGGHQGRTRDGAPGWRSVWKGWRHLADMTEGARLFAPPSRRPKRDMGKD